MVDLHLLEVLGYRLDRALLVPDLLLRLDLEIVLIFPQGAPAKLGEVDVSRGVGFFYGGGGFGDWLLSLKLGF